MIAVSGAFLDRLRESADAAGAEEKDFRQQSARRIAALEQARAFAFRKWNLMRAVTQAVAGAENTDQAVARASSVLRDKLDWASDSEARTAVLQRFAAVVRAMLGERDPGGVPADVLAALDAFERWYAETHPKPFWSLFEQYAPETPLVDF